MRRTTIYLEPDLDVLLKKEVLRQRRPMAELIRDALRAYLSRAPGKAPPGAGAFTSGRRDTAAKAEDLLRRSRFGEEE
jgi:hypothetical protein